MAAACLADLIHWTLIQGTTAFISLEYLLSPFVPTAVTT